MLVSLVLMRCVCESPQRGDVTSTRLIVACLRRTGMKEAYARIEQKLIISHTRKWQGALHSCPDWASSLGVCRNSVVTFAPYSPSPLFFIILVWQTAFFCNQRRYLKLLVHSLSFKHTHTLSLSLLTHPEHPISLSCPSPSYLDSMKSDKFPMSTRNGGQQYNHIYDDDAFEEGEWIGQQFDFRSHLQF